MFNIINNASGSVSGIFSSIDPLVLSPWPSRHWGVNIFSKYTEAKAKCFDETLNRDFRSSFPVLLSSVVCPGAGIEPVAVSDAVCVGKDLRLYLRKCSGGETTKTWIGVVECGLERIFVAITRSSDFWPAVGLYPTEKTILARWAALTPTVIRAATKRIQLDTSLGSLATETAGHSNWYFGGFVSFNCVEEEKAEGVILGKCVLAHRRIRAEKVSYIN